MGVGGNRFFCRLLFCWWWEIHLLVNLEGITSVYYPVVQVGWITSWRNSEANHDLFTRTKNWKSVPTVRFVHELFLEQFPTRWPCADTISSARNCTARRPVSYSRVFGVCNFVLRRVNWAWQGFHNFPSTERAEQLEQFYKIVPPNNFPNLLFLALHMENWSFKIIPHEAYVQTSSKR